MSRIHTPYRAEQPDIVYRLNPSLVRLEKRKRINVAGWYAVAGFGCFWPAQGCFAAPSQGGVGGDVAFSAAAFGWTLLSESERKPYRDATAELEQRAVSRLLAKGFARSVRSQPPLEEQRRRCAERMGSSVQASVFPWVWRYLQRHGHDLSRDGVPACLWLLAMDDDARRKLIDHCNQRHEEQKRIDAEAVAAMRSIIGPRGKRGGR